MEIDMSWMGGDVSGEGGWMGVQESIEELDGLVRETMEMNV